METKTTEGDFWCLGNFWGVIEVPKMEEGVKYIFLDQQSAQQRDGAVFPFTLPADDPDNMRIHDCVQIGCMGNPNVEDVRLLVSNSTLRVISFDRLKGELQHEGPALTFPMLLSYAPISAGRSPSLVAPKRPVLTPDYTHFHIYLTIDANADLSAPLTVCVMMDAYIPSAASRGLWQAAEFTAHLDICEHDIKALRNDLGQVEPEDVKQVYQDSSITVISVEGLDLKMLKAHMDSLFVNLRMANDLGYETRDQKERYLNAKHWFFALQKEHHIFYDDDDLG